MTIHFESVRALVIGADYQQKIADDAQARAEAIAQQVGPLEQQLLALRKELAGKQNEAMEHDRLAGDFRELAREKCEANGWDMPDPAAVPDQPEQPHAMPPPHGISVMCAEGVCKTDRDACEGCTHDCHWIQLRAAAEAPVEQTRPDVPEASAQAEAVDTGSWLSLAWIRLPGRTRARHKGHWRLFARRAGSLIEEAAAHG